MSIHHARRVTAPDDGLRYRLLGIGFVALVVFIGGCQPGLSPDLQKNNKRDQLGVADCPPGTNVIVGTAGNDTLTGTAGADCIVGLAGDDIINGLGGDDFIIGGAGNDTIDGGNGDDIIYGEDGDDNIKGGNGNDLIYGGVGNDKIEGGNGNDLIYGGAGNDEIKGGKGSDILFGGAGFDEVEGGKGNDYLIDLQGPNQEVEGGKGFDVCVTITPTQGCELVTSVLPVELDETRALLTDVGVSVQWSTSSERQNLGFHVYRQRGSGPVEQVTEQLIGGLGDSPVGGQYQWTDPHGRLGDRYFVETRGVDGSTRRSEPIAVLGRVDASLREPPPRSPALRLSPRLQRRWSELRDQQDQHPEQGDDREGDDDGRRVFKLAIDAPGLYRLPPELAHARREIRLGGGSLGVTDDAFFVASYQPTRSSPGAVLRIGEHRGPEMREAHSRECERSQSWAEVRQHEERQWLYQVTAPSEDPMMWTHAYTGHAGVLDFDVAQPLSAAARVQVRVQPLPSWNRTHNTRLWLNGVDLGAVSWAGVEQVSLGVQVPAGALRDGANRLRLEPDSGDFDFFYIDDLTLRYPRSLSSIREPVELRVAAGRCLQVDRGVDQDFILIDASDDERPVAVRAVDDDERCDDDDHDDAGCLETGALWRVPGHGLAERTLYFARRDAVPWPQALGPLSPKPELRPDTDYLVISAPDFVEEAEILAQYRRRLGHETQVVTTEQIYDHLGDGRADAQLLRAYILRLAERSRLQYVVLFGGASVDPSGQMGGFRRDLVPTLYARQQAYHFEIASDTRLVMDGQGRLVAAIGRIAAQTQDEARAVILKTLMGDLRPRRGRLLQVRDHEHGGVPLLEHVGQATLACQPREVELSTVAVGHDRHPQAAMTQVIERGVDMLTYIGHAGTGSWSRPHIASVAWARSLTNPPFVLSSVSCYDGAFAGPWGESLAWALVSAPIGGARAAINSSSLSDTASASALLSQLNCNLAQHPGVSLGQALRAVKQALLDQADTPRRMLDAIDAYNLLGDPAASNPLAPSPGSPSAAP